MTSFYFDFNFPLKVVQLIHDLIFGAPSPNNPQPAVDPATREWFSQPRVGTDINTEVITTVFKLPLSVSELTLEVLRMPCVVEVWYLDRSNNWRPVLDMQRIPLKFAVSRADVKSFYKYQAKAYPIVAKQLQFRLTRTNDPSLEGAPYVLGLRNCLIRRNVYDRALGSQYFEDEQDVLGNVVSKYIKDWDATKAADDEPITFWKSEPMPDPSAVCSLFLDVRNDNGGPRNIDKVYLDPVYSGQHLNLYYSNDDTIGTLKLSPITIVPNEDENTGWRSGVGRTDISTGLAPSFYRFPFSIGPLNRQPVWIGIEWTPDFDPASGPPVNPVLLEAMAPYGAPYKPKIYYDVGAGEFVLEFQNDTNTRTYTASPTQLFSPGDSVRIVAGWKYGPDKVFLSVVNRRGVEIAYLEDDPTTLPALVSLDGIMQMADFSGIFTAHIIKLDDYATGYQPFQASPTYYVDPDPVIPDDNGVVPSTTLDNAVYGAAWTAQEHGSGGSHETVFEHKEWTPIWRDYVATKGMLYFPQALSMKYLKLEFSQLTEEAYPIYESGIDVKYKVFPISVYQQSTLGAQVNLGIGGFLGLGSFIQINNRTINPMDPQSILGAIGSVFQPQIPPVTISYGNGIVTDTLPNQDGTQVVQDTNRLELASAYVYRRETQQPYVLAQAALTVDMKKDPIQGLLNSIPIGWDDLVAANPVIAATAQINSNAVPGVRAEDWWVFPGQLLRLPATIMERLSGSSIVSERKATLEKRIRFNTTSVHRYEYRTLRRDATLAYFAGVREVTPYTSTFIDGEDKDYFDFASYDAAHWTWTNIQQIPDGPVSSAAALYRPNTPAFDYGLSNWTAEPGDVAWSADMTIGHWKRGTAKATADGFDNGLLSSRLTVAEGTAIEFRAWVKWADLVAAAGTSPITLGGVGYTGNTVVDTYVFADCGADPAPDSDWVQFVGTWTVPAGVNGLRIRLGVSQDASAGEVWFDTITARDGSADPTGTLFKSLQTTSSFAKVTVDFRDSGLMRSDSMWADADANTPSINDEDLAYYVDTIPSDLPAGFWGDTIKAWGGSDVEWGTPYAVVSVSVDGNRRYQGKRVLHFRRAAGAGQAGIKIKQWTHFMPLALFRIGAVVYKTLANDNVITVRLRRISDGVIVYETSIVPPVGRWWQFETAFTEIPDSADQDYTVELTLDGDSEDDLYLSDLYTDVAPIRYFCRLGSVGATMIEVTDLRHSVNQRAQVSTTTPVNQMTIQAVILDPESWAFGCRIVPQYLQ